MHIPLNALSTSLVSLIHVDIQNGTWASGMEMQTFNISGLLQGLTFTNFFNLRPCDLLGLARV